MVAEPAAPRNRKADADWRQQAQDIADDAIVVVRELGRYMVANPGEFYTDPYLHIAYTLSGTVTVRLMLGDELPTVFEWLDNCDPKLAATIHRPGRWVTYLARLATTARAQRDERERRELAEEAALRAPKFQPYDDALLFPDIHLD